MSSVVSTGARHARRTDRARSTRALGWASLGLGIAQVSAPEAVSRIAGIDDSPTARAVIRMIGIRELTHAGGLLSGRRKATWAWTRVAGDALDLAALTRALRTSDRQRRGALVTAAVAGITAVDVAAAIRASRRSARASNTLHLRASITINRAPDEVYRFWRDFENLPTFMSHVEAVQVADGGRSHWTAKAPAGRSVEWDAEIVEDVPDKVVAWKSLKGADVPNQGSVRFRPAPGDRGTEVRVDIVYSPPGGKLGTAFATLFGEHPEQQVRDDLRRLKQVIEAGEVVRSEGSPEGTNALQQLKQRPAQALPATAP